MAKAIWNDIVLAESDTTVIIEGNHYFPPSSVKQEHLTESDNTSVCFWKGTAHYYDVKANGGVNRGAAWYYPEPTRAVSHIKDYIAFWKGIEIQE